MSGESLDFGSGFQGARVTLWREDGNAQTAKFFVIPTSTPCKGDDSNLRVAMARRLFGEVSVHHVMLSVSGVEIDDARLLRDGDRVVVRLQTDLKDPATADSSADKAQSLSTVGAELPAQDPREVKVSFILNNIKEVDAVANSVWIDVQLYLTWVEPTIIGVPVEDRPPYTEELRGEDSRPCLWNPNVEVNNDLDLETLWSVFPAQHQGIEEGIIRWGARYRGHVANPMDLHKFPFDADTVTILVGSKDKSTKECILIVDPAKHGFEGAPGDTIKESGLEEWDLGSVNVIAKDSKPSGSGTIYSNVEYGCLIYRRVGYYFWKVLLMKMILIVSCFSIFSQDPLEDFADRQAHTFTLALTVVAFLHVAGQDLPKVPYLTIMDKTMLLGFFVLFLAGVENWVVYVIAKDGDLDLAETIDKWCLTSCPLIYFAAMVYYGFSGMKARWRRGGKGSPKQDAVMQQAQVKQEQVKLLEAQAQAADVAPAKSVDRVESNSDRKSAETVQSDVKRSSDADSCKENDMKAVKSTTSTTSATKAMAKKKKKPPALNQPVQEQDPLKGKAKPKI